MTTSWPTSTSRLACSRHISATRIWFSGGSSNVLEITWPRTLRFMSVTSSGRSSTRRTIRVTSGWFAAIELAIAFIIVVLPTLGGDTTRPRWPLPMGEMMSMMRSGILSGTVSIFSRSTGKRGVSSSKFLRFVISGDSVAKVLTLSTRSIPANFSPSLGARIRP